MLIRVNTINITGEIDYKSLHSQREVARYPDLLELAKAHWPVNSPETQRFEGERPLGVILEAESDVTVLKTTEQLNAERRRFQRVKEGIDDFVFDVGEEIIIPCDATAALYAKLEADYGVSQQSIGYLNRLFEDRRIVTRRGNLPFYVVHLARPGRKPYNWIQHALSICCGVTEHKPYYELMPKGIRNGEAFAYVIFMPKGLVESVARLHPQPKGLGVYATLRPGRAVC